MAKAAKKRATKYEKPLVVKTNFEQMMKLAMEDANKKSEPKKKP